MIQILKCIFLGKWKVLKPKKVELSYPMRKAFAELREVNTLREKLIEEIYRRRYGGS